jgi:hypothetical protein
MAYTYSNEIKYADSVNLDAFGRLRTSNLTTLLDIKHPYNKLPLLVDEEIGGSATSVWADTSVVMSTSADEEFVVRQTIKSAAYQSGKSQLFEASFSGFNIETNITKRVGYFTSTVVSPFNSSFDGFFLESNGTSNEISFQIWKGGTNILNVPTSSWLGTDYDVALMDWSQVNLMFVDFQWLGVGRLRFYMVIDGIPRLFYANTAIGNISTVYMDQPNKPIRYEIRQAGAGSGSFAMICSGVSMEGSINSLYRPVTINDFSERNLSTSGTAYAILGIRISGSTPYPGVIADISQVDLLQSSNDNYLVTIQKAPVLSASASWNTLTDTPLEYSFGAGLLTVTTPGLSMVSTMGKSGSTVTEKVDMGDSVFGLGYYIDGTPEEWWVCIQSTGNNSKFRTGVNIKYYA